LIVDLIDKERLSSLSADVKGDAYEGLLQKNAEDVKGGAGQYFTPRSLIAAMVEVVAPQPGETICDPACGTGGFLLAAHDFIAKNPKLDRAQKKQLKSGTFFGIELVDSVTRLCAMNLLLHGEYEVVLANPPFGKKSSVTIVNDAGEQSKESLVINRDDFWASTSNKQLNFLQHIFTILKMHGRAAVVLPDNVLFEGGAGETIRRELLKQADVHTLLRLPTGIFYAQGVKANVLFFERKPAQEKPWTKKLWIYDLRTNLHFTLKENTLKRTDLDDFVACYFGRSGSSGRSGSGVPPLKSGEDKRQDAASTFYPEWLSTPAKTASIARSSSTTDARRFGHGSVPPSIPPADGPACGRRPGCPDRAGLSRSPRRSGASARG